MSTLDKITQNYLDGKMSEQGYLAALGALAKIANEPEQVGNPPPSSKSNGKPDPSNATTGVEIFARQGKNKVLLGTIRQFRQRGGLYWVDKVLICANATLQGHDLKAFERNAVTASGKSVGTWRVMPTGKGCVENGINPYEQPQQAIDKVKSLDLYNARTAVLLPNGNVGKPEKITVSVNVPPAPSKVQSVPEVPEKQPAISIHDWRKNVYSHLVDNSWIESGQGWTAENMHSEAVTAQAKLAQAGIKVDGKVTQVPYSTLISLAIANDLL